MQKSYSILNALLLGIIDRQMHQHVLQMAQNKLQVVLQEHATDNIFRQYFNNYTGCW